jgi:hypothetical protein
LCVEALCVAVCELQGTARWRAHAHLGHSPLSNPPPPCPPSVNRRMDDWVSTADLDLSTVEPEVIEVGGGVAA